ncbi:hypothetical protein HYX08_00730 [Candidatus Woesearchaeota archaeon]|nr:hypothetical protein [Candidatus Woesearchaeota archaeon]
MNRLAAALAAVYVAAAAYGCATRGSVNEVQQQSYRTQQAVSALEQRANHTTIWMNDMIIKGLDETAAVKRRVERIEDTLTAGASVTITRAKDDFLFKYVLGEVLKQYENPKSREEAEKYANAMRVTNISGPYFVVELGIDANNDGILSNGIDRRLVDVRNGRMATSFRLFDMQMPQQVKDAMGKK